MEQITMDKVVKALEAALNYGRPRDERVKLILKEGKDDVKA